MNYKGSDEHWKKQGRHSSVNADHCGLQRCSSRHNKQPPFALQSNHTPTVERGKAPVQRHTHWNPHSRGSYVDMPSACHPGIMPCVHTHPPTHRRTHLKHTYTHVNVFLPIMPNILLPTTWCRFSGGRRSCQLQKTSKPEKLQSSAFHPQPTHPPPPLKSIWRSLLKVIPHHFGVLHRTERLL